LALPTEEPDSGLLPTPSAVSYGTNQGGSMGRTGKVRPSLQHMAKHDLWPTPAASAHKRNGKENAKGRGFSPNLPEVAGGTLNPAWVEWLMGFPAEWTDLER
jgi:hypothetical protein